MLTKNNNSKTLKICEEDPSIKDLSIRDPKTLPPTNNIPDISESDIIDVVKKNYNLHVCKIKECLSFYDKNFEISIILDDKNTEHLKNENNKYIVKVLNSKDSDDIQFVDAQIAVAHYLNDQEVTCPEPVKNIMGEYYSVENFNGKRHIIRMLEFKYGTLFVDAPGLNNDIYFEVGELAYLLNTKLRDYHHIGIENHKHIWMMENVPQLRQFTYMINNQEMLDMFEKVIQEFEEIVVPQMSFLERGVIHGDLNEQNILVEKRPDTNKWQISVLLDFGDIQVTCLIFELAIAMTYMMFHTNDINVGGLVLAGYSAYRNVSMSELNLLKICIKARLVQSLILGGHSMASYENPESNHSGQPTKHSNGWELLALLDSESSDLVTKWMSCSQNKKYSLKFWRK